MSGKHIVFKVDVTSPVHGSFRAGDVGKNIDSGWAGDLVAGGYAAYTTDASAKADADAAADAAGRLTNENRAFSAAKKTEHVFSSADLAAQRAAGVVTTGPTDNTVGAEGTAARVAARSGAKASPAPTAAQRGSPARSVDKPTKASGQAAGKATSKKK